MPIASADFLLRRIAVSEPNVLEARKAARELARAEAERVAAELWAGFDKNEKTGVRFGMFPAKKMEPHKHLGNELAVALMGCAERDGGMRGYRPELLIGAREPV
jgi:hypothetical protein